MLSLLALWVELWVHILHGRPQKDDNDNVYLHLWELWMPHLKHSSTVADRAATTQAQQKLKTRRGGEHRRGEGSETFLERKRVLRRFPKPS